jgi:hypothetical protein
MRTLPLLVLAFVSLPVSAEELQVTITGLACTLAPPDCGAGTLSLFGLGLAGVGFMRRRNRKLSATSD